MKKRIISILVGAAMAVSIASAINAYTPEQNNTADALNSLGLFLGDENGDYMLDNSLTRAQGMTIVVRMLGAEAEAKENAATYETPFTDVPEWAAPYVGYAYVNGHTPGTGATTFTPDKELTDYEYLTWVLRALGYKDGEDAQFMWNNPYELAVEAGLIADTEANAEFVRANAVDIFWNALEAEIVVADEADDTTAAEEDTTVADDTTAAEEETTVADDTTAAEEETTVADDTTAAEEETTVADDTTAAEEDDVYTLADKLIEEGVFTAEQYEAAKLIQKEGKPADDTTAAEAETTVADDTTAAEEETTVADDTTAAEEETTVADDTTAAEEETTVAEDTTVAEEETTEAEEETTEAEVEDTLEHVGGENQLPLG
ncbi:MAG: hypothetical protein IJY93_04705 [Clostridia bacterium]|nr:hypothetical protein [Clostridia bacterium]